MASYGWAVSATWKSLSTLNSRPWTPTMNLPPDSRSLSFLAQPLAFNASRTCLMNGPAMNRHNDPSAGGSVGVKATFSIWPMRQESVNPMTYGPLVNTLGSRRESTRHPSEDRLSPPM